MITKKKLKKELIEWAIILAIPAGLYLTGTHTMVLGQLQRVVLWTGIFQPTIEIPIEEQLDASYKFKLTDYSGERVDFEAFKGKTVFINFWATWCPPCIAEMPDIESLYQKTKEDVAFVMISLDSNADKTWDFVESKGFTFPVYRLSSLMPEVYEKQVIPTTYVISPQGKIVSERHGMAKYDTEEFRSFLMSL